MSDIPTWRKRAMAHPDHQSGMVSEDMIRARMCEEIADLRAEGERLRAYVTQILLIAHQNMVCRNECGKLCREALGAKP